MMNGKRTCGSGKDLKAICPHCGNRNFASHKSSIVQFYKEQKKPLTLSCWKCRLDIDCNLSEEKEWYGCKPEDFKQTHHELIYLPYNGEDMKKLQKKFPDAFFKNAFDDIHRERFEMIVNNISKKEFVKALIQTGVCDACLGFNIALGLPNENLIKEVIKEVIKELKVEHDPCIKEEYWE